MFDRAHIFNSSFVAITAGLCFTVGFYSLFASFTAYDNPARITTLCCWLLLCTVSSLLVYRLTSAVSWSIVSFVLTFIFTESFVNESTHPQGFIVVATIVVPLAACFLSDQRKRSPWVLIGALVAAIFYTRFNAGIFALAASCVVLAAHFSINRGRGMLAAVFIAGSMAFPFVLMFPLLPRPNALPFAIITALATGAAAVIAFAVTDQDTNGKPASFFFVIGICAASSLVLPFAGPVGVTAGDIFASLLSYSASQLEFYHYFRVYSDIQLISAGISMACALCFYYSKGVRWILVLGKSYFVAVALFSILINNTENAHALLGYAGPWCWLVVTGGRTQNLIAARLLLTTIAAWSPLLAYPIPESQLYFASLPILLAAVVCTADILSWTDSLVVERAFPFMASLMVLIALLLQLSKSSSQYYGDRPLDRPAAYSSIMAIKSRENLYASPGQRADK